jgi:peptidoglycan/LPS O-acetylase OafA/YrhL
MVSHMGAFPGYLGMDGGAAVKFFFMISGFYMAMILNEKYGSAAAPYRTFITSRFLRIYPLYYIVLALSLLASLALNHRNALGDILLIPNYTDASVMSLATKLLFGFSFLSLLGMSCLSFFTEISPDTGNPHMTLDVYAADNPGYSFFAIPQAWTLDVEIVFYCLAPLFLRDKRKIATFLGASLFVNALFWCNVFGETALSNFFPAQLWIFCLGAFAYYGYKRIENSPHFDRMSRAAFWLILLIIGAHKLLPGLGGELCGLALMFLCLPLIFKHTKNIAWDRAIGELSYPVYLCHILVLSIIEALYGGPLSGPMKGVAVLSVLAFSAVLYLGVAKPIDKYRYALARITAAA